MINTKKLIIKTSIIYLLSLHFWTCAQDNKNIEKAAEITENIFGPIGINVRFDQLEMVEKVFYECLSASPYQLSLAIHHIIPVLTDKLDTVKKEIQKYKDQHKQVPYKLFYKKFLLKEQINHFNTFIKSLGTSVMQKLQDMVYHTYEIIQTYIKSFFGHPYIPPTPKRLAQNILKYIDFERETVLYNYQNLISFLHSRQSNQLPKIIDFWDTQEIQEKLYRRAQQVSNDVKVQVIGALVEFALQGLIMAGGEVSIQWYKDEDRKIFEEYQKKQTKISKDWETFQKKLKKDQKEIVNNIIKSFKNEEDKIKQKYKDNNTRLREALVYLNQSINLDKPIKRYLVNPIEWDKYFATSIMYVPKKCKWYNLYNVFAEGDWEFDSKTNSFWQNAMTNIPEKIYWKQSKDDRNIFTQDPAIYSIFAEYIPQKLNYDIEIECRLINCQYPFFAGIMFNRGRWISGDPERIWWYRLLGLYGTQEKADDKETRTVNLSFAQQMLEIPSGDKKEKEKITSPLEQIMNNKTKPLNFALDKKEVASLETNPTTFTFKLTNKADTVLLELDKKENGKTQKLYSGSVKNLDPYIYLFHGIGFMAVGCQAEFKIIKPEPLIYNDKELKNFEDAMKKILNTTKS